MKYLIFLFVCILSFGFQLNAQKNKEDKPGKDFIINIADDTIWGKIS